MAVILVFQAALADSSQEYQPDRTENLSRGGTSGNSIEQAISLSGMIQASQFYHYLPEIGLP